MTSDAGHERRVLIVSTDPVVAALLGTLVELDGYKPLFPDQGETPEQALVRHRPDLALVDCDDGHACASSFFERSAAQRTGVVLFSPARLQDDVRQVAQRHGLTSFALPVDRATLARILADALVMVLLFVRSA